MSGNEPIATEWVFFVKKNERATFGKIAGRFGGKKKLWGKHIFEKVAYQPELARTNSINQNWRARNSPIRVTLTLKSFRYQNIEIEATHLIFFSTGVFCQSVCKKLDGRKPPLDPFMFMALFPLFPLFPLFLLSRALIFFPI